MSLRFILAKRAGQFTKWSLRKLKRNATSLPGKVSLFFDPNFLMHYSKKHRIIMVTGTNGKTLTTSLITHVLKQKYTVLSNESGSNMTQGISTTLLNTKNEDFIVLEVDEANLKKLTPTLKPEIVVFTNVFKDQTDRYSDIETTYQHMVDGVKLVTDAIIISNGDSPLFNHDDLSNRKLFFGFNHYQDTNETVESLCPNCSHLLNYNLVTYSNLGDYYCEECGFKRPHLHYEVTKLNQLNRSNSKFELDHTEFTLNVGGLYNIYNALAAYSVGKYLEMSNQDIQNGFNAMPVKFGRQEEFSINHKNIILNLVKNPVGFNQIVDLIELDPKPKSLVVLLNDNIADGQDISWIHESDFEKLSTLNIIQTLAGGSRVEDLKLRLDQAGFNNLSVSKSLSDVINLLPQLQSDNIYILATYTALLQLRELLTKENIIEQGLS